MSSGDAPRSARGARAVEIAAQAKLNLRLRILAKETTGYHQLETLFLRIELADTLRIRRTPDARSLDVTGTVDAALIGPVEKNLVWRAAELYFAASGMRGGFAIELEKRIPIGGGLGGGSADAGAALRALSAMDDEPMDPEYLLSLAEQLGADVPFLATEHAYALAWGRGERMLALTPPPARDVMLLVPSFSVNTAEAFGWLGQPAAGISGRRRTESVAFVMTQLSDWDALRTLVRNDFEWAVERHHPELLALREYLGWLGRPVVGMSGSGSTLFAIWTSDSPRTPPAGLALEVPSGVRFVDTRTATRVEQVSVIE